jgi:DNA-binding NarL/FixJ family response regulator
VIEPEEQKQDSPPCPLSPALLRLLQDAVALGTTNNKQLANYRGCPEETIKSLFYRINVVLGTKSRSEAILQTISNNWIDTQAK